MSGDDRVYALDVVRHLLPDVVVFATTLLTLIFNAVVVAGLVREIKKGDEKKRREMETGREGQTREGSAEHVAAGSSEAAESGKNTLHFTMCIYMYLCCIDAIIVYYMYMCVFLIVW